MRSCTSQLPTTQESFPDNSLGSGHYVKATMTWQLLGRPHCCSFIDFKGDRTLGCESTPGTARKKEGRGCCRSYALPLQANASSLDMQEVPKGSAPPAHAVHPRETVRHCLDVAKCCPAQVSDICLASEGTPGGTPRSMSKGGAGQDAGQRPSPSHTLLFVLRHMFLLSKYA